MMVTISDPYAPVREYFRSIERVFEETLTSKGQTDYWEKARNVFIFLTVFSFLPVLPYGSWRLLRLHSFQVYQIKFSLSYFWMWWLLYVVVCTSIVVFLSKLTSKRNEAKEKTWLSRPQLRFALCYAVINEIGKYQTNRLPKPIAKAGEYETELWKSLLESMSSPFVRVSPVVQQSELADVHFLEHNFLHNGVDFMLRTFAWFKLDPTTQKVLDGLRGFHSKIRDRIRDKKDLSEVSACLLYLAAYLYTQIPELEPNPSGKEGTAFAQWGEEQLVSFANSVAQFPAYSSEEGRVAKQELIKKSLASRVAGFTTVFSHDNIFVCFLAWLVCLGVLVSIGTWIMLRTFAGLRMDSVLVSTIVATPIVGAATLVAIARQRIKPNQP